jgi:hypothetical protein
LELSRITKLARDSALLNSLSRKIEQDSKIAHDSASLVGVPPGADTRILAYRHNEKI